MSIEIALIHNCYVDVSISYYTIKDYCYISELALFPAYVRTDHVRAYTAIDPKRTI